MKVSVFRLFVLAVLLTGVCKVSAYKKTSIDINVSGRNRNMVVFTPNTLPENSPLMIVTHGMNQDPEYQLNADKMYELIDTAKFVIAYLRGIDKSWDMNDGGKDKDFVLKTIDEMASRYEIDTNRVYWSGFSMGSMFMYAVMGSMTDKIAAFAPCSGMMGDPSGSIRKKINLIHCHAYGDDVVVYTQFNIRNNVTKIANNLKYTNYTKRTNYRTKNGTSWFTGDREMWKNEEGNEIVLYSFNVDFHNPIAENSYEIWNFCKRYTLDPGAPKAKFTAPAATSRCTSVDTIPVSVSASDEDGYITSIKLYVDGTIKGTATFDGPSEDGNYILDYTWVRPTAKEHTLKAVITDNDKKTKTISRTVTVEKPVPLRLVEASLEDQSFDIPVSFRRFAYTFDWKIDLEKVVGKLIGGGQTIVLDVLTHDEAVEGANMQKDLVLTVPDDSVITEGSYRLTLTSIYDERGVRADALTFKYTFGIEEVDPDNPNPKTPAQIYKGGFLKAYRDARSVYDQTSDEKYAAAEFLRETVKALLDQYDGFTSTSPTLYSEATDTLTGATTPLISFKDKLDEYYSVMDVANGLLNQYADDEVISQDYLYDKLRKAVDLYSKEKYRKTEAKMDEAIKGVQSYIDRFNKMIATSIEHLSPSMSESSNVIYDLSGHRIDGNNAVKSGIYIINGKKKLIR